MSSTAHRISAGFHPVPTRLGRYEVLGKIAAGGMATVYLGRVVGAAGFERLVAIKHCHPHLMDDAEFRRMFLDEARLAARIHHPNVVATIDVCDEDGLFLVMEYVEGGRVSDVVHAAAARKAQLPLPVVLRVIMDALAGLHEAHNTTDARGRPLNLVHRDVSPQNLLVGVDGVTRVVDFGIAKAEERATVTSEHQVKGKLAYMPPEQLRSRELDARADVFAAAVVFWEMLTGRRLFVGDSRADTMQRVLSAPVTRPSRLRPEIPEAVETVLMAALSRSRDYRPRSARAFAEALEAAGAPTAAARDVGDYVRELLGDGLAARRAARIGGTEPASPVSEASASGVVEGSEKRRKRRRSALVALASVAVALAVATGAWIALGAKGGDDQPDARKRPPRVVSAETPSAPASKTAGSPGPPPPEHTAQDERDHATDGVGVEDEGPRATPPRRRGAPVRVRDEWRPGGL